MKALVVYDSFFGNTEKIAQAIGDSLGSSMEVEICRVSEFTPEQLKGLNLLIAGSPTRAFRPTKATTSFLKGIPAGGLTGVKVAAFDTRIALADVNSGVLNTMVKLFGYAAEPIGERLRKKGGSLVVPPEGFFVSDSEGPLKEGELERATAWAGSIIAAQ